MERDAACRGTRKDGQRCASVVVLDSGYCPMHDPARQRAIADARVKGGENKATSVRAERLVPSHMRPVLGAVLAAIRDVRSGAITPAQGSAIGSLAGAAVKVFQVGILEERIERLEQQQEGRARA